MVYSYAYETFKISNCNADTKIFADEVGKYLQKLSEVTMHICVDGKHYDYEDSNSSESEALSVCRTLGGYKDIEISVSSDTGFFAKLFSEAFNDTLKDYVIYKARVYDDYGGADACVFDKDGLRYVDNFTEKVPDDVKAWFCYAPEMVISAEDECNNHELYTSIKNKLDKLENYLTHSDILDDTDSFIDDEWNEYGTIERFSVMYFNTDDIPQIVGILQSIKDEITEYDSGTFTLLIKGIPDGENDYDFSIVKISGESDVKAEFLKF